MTAVTPMMVTARVMHQLVSTLGVQVTTIPITIPLTTVMETAPITLQSHLWVKGPQPKREDNERVVEVELNQEQSKSWGEEPRKEGDMQEDSQKEEPLEVGKIQEKPKGQDRTSGQESSEEDNESSREKGKKNDSHSTLTSKEESEAKQGPEPVSKLLKSIPSLIDDTTLLSTSSAAFDLEDPFGVKAMKTALATTTGSKGPKGPRKQKATTPLKKLASMIKLARENACLKLKGSTPSGFYKRPKAPKGKDKYRKKWRPGTGGSSPLPGG